MVVETAALSEAVRGEYGRQRGRYPEPLQVWRRAGEQANAGQAASRPKTDTADQRFGNWSASCRARKRP